MPIAPRSTPFQVRVERAIRTSKARPLRESDKINILSPISSIGTKSSHSIKAYSTVSLCLPLAKCLHSYILEKQ